MFCCCSSCYSCVDVPTLEPSPFSQHVLDKSEAKPTTDTFVCAIFKILIPQFVRKSKTNLTYATVMTYLDNNELNIFKLSFY
jgi:hypothetical protein